MTRLVVLCVPVVAGPGEMCHKLFSKWAFNTSSGKNILEPKFNLVRVTLYSFLTLGVSLEPPCSVFVVVVVVVVVVIIELIRDPAWPVCTRASSKTLIAGRRTSSSPIRRAYLTLTMTDTKTALTSPTTKWRVATTAWNTRLCTECVRRTVPEVHTTHTAPTTV